MPCTVLDPGHRKCCSDGKDLDIPLVGDYSLGPARSTEAGPPCRREAIEPTREHALFGGLCQQERHGNSKARLPASHHNRVWLHFVAISKYGCYQQCVFFPLSLKSNKQ